MWQNWLSLQILCKYFISEYLIIKDNFIIICPLSSVSGNRVLIWEHALFQYQSNSIFGRQHLTLRGESSYYIFACAQKRWAKFNLHYYLYRMRPILQHYLATGGPYGFVGRKEQRPVWRKASLSSYVAIETRHLELLTKMRSCIL